MKKKEMKTKVMAVAMSATMAASICPAVPAMAVTKDQVAKDGTYMSQEQRMMMKMNGMNMMSE